MTKARNDTSSDYLLVLILLPLVASVASYFDSRILILATFLVIGLLVFFVVLRADVAVQDQVFPLVIGCVSLSLLLSTNLISNNLSGSDIQIEFNIFQQVNRLGFWRPTNPIGITAQVGSAAYYSSLSISILPVIIGKVTGLPDVTTLQLVFSILWALGPVVLYKVYRKLLEPRYAFLSVFLFMSYTTFYQEMIQLARQEIAELLLIVLLWALFEATIRATRARALLAILLLFGIIAAHYSMGYLTMFMLGFSWIASRISRKASSLGTGSLILAYVVMAVGWYALAAEGVAVADMGHFLSFVTTSFQQELMNPGSRPVLVQQALGLGLIPGPLHIANRITQYVSIFCIIIGFVVFLRKSQKTIPGRQMIPLTTAGFILLFASAFVPFFAASLNFSRFFSFALLFISPCFVYGVNEIAFVFGDLIAFLRGKSQRNRLRSTTLKAWLLVAVILFSYFMFTSGWVWAVGMDPSTTYIFDNQRMRESPDPSMRASYWGDYILDEDIAATNWLTSHFATGHFLCADYNSLNSVLTSYGGFSGSQMSALPASCRAGNYVYLNILNTRYGIAWQGVGLNDWISYNPQLDPVLRNRVYSNGATAIYG